MDFLRRLFRYCSVDLNSLKLYSCYKMYNVSLVQVLEKKLVYSVWVCLKAVITENTLKEKSDHKNNFYDNYN